MKREKGIAILFILFLAVFSIAAPAQQINKEFKSAWKVFNEYSSKGLYLKAYNHLVATRHQYLDSNTSVFDKSAYYDVMVQLYNYFGEYEKAAAMEDKFLEQIDQINKIRSATLRKVTKSPVDSFAMVKAVDAIIAVAAERQVIMINEEHRNSSHREFTREILPMLYNKGFRYLALETIFENDSLLHKRKYPVINTGSYTRDPVFGELVRQALQLGFKLIGYDHASSSGILNEVQDPGTRENLRDSFAARMIIHSILKEDPGAKIIVHAGRGHVAKVKKDNWAMMAYHFKKFSGIDPFTIDQTSMSSFANPLDESPIYQYVKSRYILKEPMVFQKPDKSFWTGSSGYDMMVFSPAPEYTDGIADWLIRSGKRKIISINYKKLAEGLPYENKDINKTRVVQIYHKGENEEAIPARQILVVPGEKPTVKLALFKGKYVVQLRDEDNKVLNEYGLVVPHSSR